jgi:hypothetical protein
MANGKHAILGRSQGGKILRVRQIIQSNIVAFAQIIFLAGFAGRGCLNKDATIARWS